jgi:hypothetical protein
VPPSSASAPTWFAKPRSAFATSPSATPITCSGSTEAGGTSVLFLAAVDFARLGFRTGLRKERYPQLTWNVLSRLPNVVSVAGVGMAGVWWLMNRREAVALEEKEQP